MNKDELQIKLVEFLASKDTQLPIPMTPVRTVEDALEDLSYSFQDLDGEETNGWAVDFWYKFLPPNKKMPTLCMSGSLFHGDFKITKE